MEGLSRGKRGEQAENEKLDGRKVRGMKMTYFSIS
jgi:hypothetical protein